MKRILITLLVFSSIIKSTAQMQLYGLTSFGGNSGGDYGIGTIFHYNPAIAAQTLDQSFIYTTPGASPQHAELTDGGNNKFYGMTVYGGLSNQGIIFEWDPATNLYTKKIDFSGSNGANPWGSLTLNGGKFYGMTSNGGSGNKGVIFEWDPSTNIYKKKIDFDGTNGAIQDNPNGKLIFNGGKFYGTTPLGGLNNEGVVFEWDPITNVYTKKIDLSDTTGSNPFASMTLDGGKFYGTTSAGGANALGVIFEWDPATNIYTKKVDFDNTNGAIPYSSMAQSSGKFYGMTYNGGSEGIGVIFEWDPATNIYTKKIDFNSANGGYTTGFLTLNAGKFYGMTQSGGANSKGVIFEWDPVTNIYTKKIDFGGVQGEFPKGSLVITNSKFYGVTSEGGANNGNGTIFEWDPATNIYTKKIDFNGTNGNRPLGSLAVSSGKLYGTTGWGGANNDGVIFEWDPLANTYTKKFDFNYSTTGALPQAAMTLKDGKFYGITMGGGTGGATYTGGVIFEWDPGTNIYSKKIDLNPSLGYAPTGSLTFYAGKFYGMNSLSGTTPNTRGNIFEWDPATNIYTIKISFDGKSNGGVPNGSLTLSDGKFYGMTSQGGADNHTAGGGVIFEWDPLTNIYTKKIDFDPAQYSTTGNRPVGSLTLNDGKFYGMTPGGGLNASGVIFEWDPVTNIYTKKIDFYGSTGGAPNGSLTLSGGKFYGMTPTGGANNKGVIFEWNPSSNIYSKTLDFTDNNGSIPYGDLVEFNFSSLPVKLLSFTASIQNNNDAELTWKIAAAEGGTQYELQKSSDGQSFQGIAAQKGTQLTSFKYTDRSLSNGTYYYRLQMTDKDGKITYSNIAIIKVGSKDQLISAYPNPIKRGENLQVTLQNITANKIEMMNTVGQVVYSIPGKITGSITIPMSPALPTGQYVIRVTGDNKIKNQRIIIH